MYHFTTALRNIMKSDTLEPDMEEKYENHMD